MNRSTRPASSRWAIVVLTATTLALAGCGRKGGLDLPPQSSMQPTVDSAPVVDPESNSAANKGSSLFSSATGVPNNDPVAPKGAKKSFFLDPILGN